MHRGALRQHASGRDVQSWVSARTTRWSIGVVAALAVAFPSAVAAAPGLRLGFADGQAFTALPQDQLMVNLAHARAAGSSVIRFSVSWNSVAPTRPPTAASAADPGWQGYRWGAVDQYVRNVEAAGMQPLAIVNTAPAWAEGSR